MLKVQFIMLMLCALLACKQPTALTVSADTKRTPAQEHTMKVTNSIIELDIFSGRVNPQWVLSAEERNQFDLIVATLPEVEQLAPTLPSLGFRGVVIRQEGAASYVIYKGYVWSLEAGAVYQDSKQALRAWLLASSKAQLTPDLYELLLKESQP